MLQELLAQSELLVQCELLVLQELLAQCELLVLQELLAQCELLVLQKLLAQCECAPGTPLTKTRSFAFVLNHTDFAKCTPTIFLKG